MRAAKILKMLQIAVIGVLAWSGVAQAGVPYPNAATPQAVDLGPLSAQSASTPISFTIALSLPKLNEAETLLKSIHTPGDPQYHRFLTAEQFVARFAPADADVAKVVAGLASFGLTAERTTSTTLRVTGLPANIERAFAVSLHSYSVPAHAGSSGYNFHAPLSRPTIPAVVSPAVAAVVGLDSRPSLRPLNHAAPAIRRAPMAVPSSTTGNPPGELTVIDFASQYDVNPLYSQGILGAGRTIGIITYASFTPSDAFAYWNALGLPVSKNRIRIVNVDGGPGAPSDASGSDETTLDVEQSGGIAPKANIIVYQAPNTNQGEVDNFATAIDSNVADTISVSWGFWEWFNNLENSPVTDSFTGKTVGLTQAVHELLVRAAIQGQSVYAASGDGGAYDVNNDLGCYGPYSPSVLTSCTQTLSVDYPASDTAITAAGGTTLAGDQVFCLNAACTSTYTVKVPRKRVWGWDYLEGLCATLGAPDPITCGIFPGGGGGGVSVLFGEPSYQSGLPGVKRSQPGQLFQITPAFAAYLEVGDYFALPAHYPGRNVPDVSFNADPDTGYVIYYTSSVSGPTVLTFIGGTSFVAPQLNGVSALLGQYLHGRIGLINFPLYSLAQSNQAYRGPAPPLHAIAYGDNWFYNGSNGYNPGAGLGEIDVANFAEALREMF